ncbi:hypothetical protein [Streptomyces sp. NPDC058291]|uniref:hypothetical protein n=1 Tax=Streptomyces sp. NPDC058291 TaxID=3346427 RepID=UPI0036ED4F54
MPRGRHRHSPPLHRLLPPSAIAGVSLVCALGPWVFTDPTALRVLAAAAAVTAIVGAVVMRHWDVQAGKQVADLTRARAGDEWRFEERVAELESDLDESRELRVKLEQRLRAKRAELAGLRNEHAALLRRYATAETERASALEGRRLLEIEAAPSPTSPALPAARGAAEGGARESTEASATSESSASEQADQADQAHADDEFDQTDMTDEAGEEGPRTSAVFSPQGSKLFLRAQAALARFDADADGDGDGVKAAVGELAGDQDLPDSLADEGPARATSAEAAQEDEALGKPAAVDEHARAAAPRTAAEDDGTAEGEYADEAPPREAPPTDAPTTDAASKDATPGNEASAAPRADAAGESSSRRTAVDAIASHGEAAWDEAGRTAVPAQAALTVVADDVRATRPEPPLEPELDPELDPDPDPGPGSGPGRGAAAVAEPAAAAEAGAVVRRPATRVQRPSGHFAVPTAVAVVPAAEPVRRPTAEGGFDFFGTQSDAEPDALEAVQNEDLADVVGQEALALHKAESEAEFKPADEASRGVSQVIDLTAHDETEHIDLKGLRSAVS